MNKKPEGFTLVELAIVMIIIGILIGGILKGQEMIRTASVNTTIKKAEEARSGMMVFYDSFDALPGDFAGATQKLPGCNAGVNCLDGNGNTRIGNAVINWSHDDQSGLDTEPTQFWKHLALADLVNGVNVAATSVSWGESHPDIPIGGGMHLFFSNQSGAGQSMHGHNLYLRQVVSGDPHSFIGGNFSGATMTPHEAWFIDRRIDDGNGLTGAVRADPNSGHCTDAAGVYADENIDSCLVAINISR